MFLSIQINGIGREMSHFNWVCSLCSACHCLVENLKCISLIKLKWASWGFISKWDAKICQSEGECKVEFYKMNNNFYLLEVYAQLASKLMPWKNTCRRNKFEMAQYSYYFCMHCKYACIIGIFFMQNMQNWTKYYNPQYVHYMTFHLMCYEWTVRKISHVFHIFCLTY